ncbi:hypothetical protein WJX74_003209 [Apatococcus lobatus]|uniref:PWI domain-containing protein n=1 Tax=Apatococcus lobatus TaxID=904363 RepID=A0AAW1R3V0_9CHLO
MAGIGGFRGVSAHQDVRFSDKERKLLKSGKFPAEYSLPVDRKKINWEVMKQWITRRVTELLGIEDEILVLFIIEECQNSQDFDPKKLQIRFTSFLEKNTTLFMKELWSLLASATTTDSGIPQPILDKLAEDIQQKKDIQDAINDKLGKERERRALEDKVERAERRRADKRAEEEHKERDAKRRERDRGRDSSRERRKARDERHADHRHGAPRDRDPDRDRREHEARPEDRSKASGGREQGERDRQHARSPILSARRSGRSRSPRPADRPSKRDRSRSVTPIRRSLPATAARAERRDRQGRRPQVQSPQQTAREDRHASPSGRANGHDPERVTQEAAATGDRPPVSVAAQLVAEEDDEPRSKKVKKEKVKKAKKEKKKLKKEKKDKHEREDDKSSGPSGAEEDDLGHPASQIEALRQRSLENDLRRKALLANKGDER